VAGVAFEHVGDGFDAAMGVGGESGDWPFDGVVEGEMVEQEEGVEGVGAAGAEGALEPDACPFDYHLGLDKLLNWTGGCHDWVSFFGSRSLVIGNWTILQIVLLIIDDLLIIMCYIIIRKGAILI
jgi:hypothetical protein